MRAVRRRWRWLAAVLAVLVVADAIVVVASRPDQDEYEAASAVVVAAFDTDPDPGEEASCDFAPGARLVLWRASYDCEATVCRHEFARVRLTHVLGGGWSYRVTSGGRVGDIPSGTTFPTTTKPIAMDLSDCP